MPKRIITKDIINEYLNTKLTQKDLGEKYGFDQSSLCHHLKDNHIKIPRWKQKLVHERGASTIRVHKRHVGICGYTDNYSHRYCIEIYSADFSLLDYVKIKLKLWGLKFYEKKRTNIKHSGWSLRMTSVYWNKTDLSIMIDSFGDLFEEPRRKYKHEVLENE